jgi:5-methylcytosine-specific restriction enzyme A
VNQHRYYDQHKRDQEAKAFYNSKAWKVCRDLVLKRDDFICVKCFEKNVMRKADVVHHIVHFKNDPSLAFDLDNLISLCNSCHNKEHPEKGQKQEKPEKQKKRNLRVVVEKPNEERW